MRMFLALFAMLALALPAAAQAQRRADWVHTIARTAEGGFRMGNPAAPVKLVEYGSITCPHCAEFDAEAAAGIRRQVATGRVSFEYRPYLIFPSDPGLFLLMGCLAPARFFDTLDQLYATQRTWVTRLQATPAAEQQRIEGLPFGPQAGAWARATGLMPFFQQRGLTPARANACLADAAALNRLANVTRAGNAAGVQGTPTFFINGRPVGTLSWAALEPMLGGR